MGGKMTKRRRRHNNGLGIYRTECPCCSYIARTVKIERLAHHYKQFTFRCEDTECGYTWVCGLEPLRALTVTGKNINKFTLPLSPHLKQKKDSIILQLNQREFTPKPQEVQGELDV